MVDEIDIKYLLRAWANSIVSHRMGVEYPSNSTPFIGANREVSYKAILEEEMVNAINGAYHNLTKQNPKLAAVIKLYYLQNKSVRDAAKIVQESNSGFFRKLNDAEYFILGCLYGFIAQSRQYYASLEQNSASLQ